MTRSETKGLLIHLPPSSTSRAEVIAIPLEESTSAYVTLKMLAEQGVTPIAEFLQGAGSTNEGQVLIIINGQMISFFELSKLLFQPGDELHLIPPILGG